MLLRIDAIVSGVKKNKGGAGAGAGAPPAEGGAPEEKE